MFTRMPVYATSEQKKIALGTPRGQHCRHHVKVVDADGGPERGGKNLIDAVAIAIDHFEAQDLTSARAIGQGWASLDLTEKFHR
jgi:hypothetical protein